MVNHETLVRHKREAYAQGLRTGITYGLIVGGFTGFVCAMYFLRWWVAR